MSDGGGVPAAAPVAPHVGPFADVLFLEVLHAHWGEDELLAATSDGSAAHAELVNGEVVGVGHRDLVDYRSPTGPHGVDLLAGLVADRPFRIDSMPIEVAGPLAEQLRTCGRVVEVQAEDSTAVLRLPESYDVWLSSIGKKERHETRRKRRRYEELIGNPRVARFDQSDQRLDEFVSLHRTSPGEKGSFMTDAMAAFFRDLLPLPGWGIDALLTSTGSMAAAGFGYHGADGYYLYNSAFDPTLREASPGVVLMASLIESAIEAARDVFDFLKGDEAYKYRLGAGERLLYTVSG